ncbi:hypothetical protein GALMADRAFT_245175 [Galerina marginata CBS 339.88]|uniref:Uncharacterized protein n=1 Tax=Galerina marginata (strain CBS 339.88) TaxID=685588 RepID=A0A067TGN9_GALM3|nr:hypothetical protein GALMADRAFT_245175 [Galerina marginata CBS 339.88]
MTSPSTSVPSTPSTTSPTTTSALPSAPSLTFPTAAVTTFVPGQPGNNGNPNNITNTTNSIATSASLYLYTFLATLVLLLSVSAAIVIRSFILRRRHRLMMEEAIRNGTWVPPAPPTRPVRVDLSKKPVLWEAYIDGKGDLVGHPAGGAAGAEGKQITDVWKLENSKDWDMIKPFAAAYLSPEEKASSTATAEPTSSPGTPAIPGLATIPSVGSLRSANLAAQTDIEAANPAVTAATPPSTTRARHRALFSRALNVLNPTPGPTSPLPAAASGTNANLADSGNTDTGMSEVKGPQVMRVAVLIAMPSQPPGSANGSLSSSVISGSTIASTSRTNSGSSSSTPPPTNPTPALSQPVTAHPLEHSMTHPSHSHSHSSTLDDDEHPLPHLEMGVADILVVPSDHATGDPSHGAGLGGKKRAAQRGSLGSMATGMSDASEV